MDFVKRHGPLLMFVTVLGLCGFLISWPYVTPKDTDAVKKFNSSVKTIDAALSAREVSVDYAYSPEQAKKLNFTSALKQNSGRTALSANDAIGTNVAYPQPARPRVIEDIIAQKPRDVFAVLGAVANVKTEAATGRVYLSLDLPNNSEQKMMEPVRVEVFRGASADAIDMSKPCGVIDVGLEEPRKITNAPPIEQNKRKDKKEPEYKLPETLRAYCDTNVAPLTVYFYRARLVGRFTSVEGKLEVISDTETVTHADGSMETKVARIPVIHHAPKNATPVLPANPASNSKLFATELTPAVAVKTPTHVQLRLAGINGIVPDGPRPAGVIRTDYSARFEVRVWISEMQEWKAAQLNEVYEGNVLSGKVLYKSNGAGSSTEYDFTNDLGLRLLEVNNEITTVHGQEVKGPVATLENLRTKTNEKLGISKFSGGTEKQNELEQVIKAQNREMARLRGELAPPAK